MTITPYTSAYHDAFEEMLVEYFVHDLQSGIPEEIVRGKLLDIMTQSVKNKTIRIALAAEGKNLIGFSIYQIDTPESDWCKHPGWGFIREFYIRKESREKGCGTALAVYTEQHLRTLGAVRLYLTSGGAIGFWKKCGWRNTHEVCSSDLEILIK